MQTISTWNVNVLLENGLARKGAAYGMQRLLKYICLMGMELSTSFYLIGLLKVKATRDKTNGYRINAHAIWLKTPDNPLAGGITGITTIDNSGSRVYTQTGEGLIEQRPIDRNGRRRDGACINSSIHQEIKGLTGGM